MTRTDANARPPGAGQRRPHWTTSPVGGPGSRWQRDATLAIYVRICDIEVMVSDVGAGARPGGGNFFPASVSSLPAIPTPTMPTTPLPGMTLAQRVATVPGLGRSELRAADAVAMAATLLGLWAAMTNRPAQELAAGAMHPDGSVRISSQVAVWLIGRVSEAYGRRKLVNLSHVNDVEALRSLGGLSKLLAAAINADTEGTLV